MNSPVVGRDRRGGLPGRVQIQVRIRVPLQEPDEDLGHDPAAHRPEPLTVVRRQLGLLENVEPQRCLAIPARIGASPRVALDSTGARIALATCCPEGRPTCLPRRVLRTARSFVGSGGGTADPGRLNSGRDSFVSILRGGRPVPGSMRKDVLPLHDQVGGDRAAAVEVEAAVRAEDRDAAAVQ